MALERVPADIRKDGGVARMSDPKLIKEIMAAVTIPVFAKVKNRVMYWLLRIDDVASRLQVSDLNKSDLQVSSRFAKDLFEISIFYSSLCMR